LSSGSVSSVSPSVGSSVGSSVGCDVAASSFVVPESPPSAPPSPSGPAASAEMSSGVLSSTSPPNIHSSAATTATVPTSATREGHNRSIRSRIVTGPAGYATRSTTRERLRLPPLPAASAVAVRTARRPPSRQAEAQPPQPIDQHRVVGQCLRPVDEVVEDLVVARRRHGEQLADGLLL